MIGAHSEDHNLNNTVASLSPVAEGGLQIAPHQLYVVPLIELS